MFAASKTNDASVMLSLAFGAWRLTLDENSLEKSEEQHGRVRK